MRKGMLGLMLVVLAPLLAACGGGSGDSAAATVNGHDISMAAYNEALWANRIHAADSAGYDVCSLQGAAAACAVLKQQALQTLIDGEIVREYAASHNLSVPTFDLDREWAVIMSARFVNRTDALAAYARRLHTTPADIKQGIADDLLQQYVIYNVAKNVPPYSPAVRLAVIRAASLKELKNIVRQLQQSHDFLREARSLSAAPSSGCSKLQKRCGDLGWIPYSFVPPNEKALFRAPLGGVAGPYASGAEYDIYLVEARSPHYKMSANQIYSMRSGLLFPQWLKRQEKAAQITRYVKV